MSKVGNSKETEDVSLNIGVVSTRFFEGRKMTLDYEIIIIVIYKAGDYVHVDKGNGNWQTVHYSRLS